MSEKYLYELKNLKMRLSDFENKENVATNLSNRVHLVE